MSVISEKVRSRMKLLILGRKNNGVGRVIFSGSGEQVAIR